MIHRIETYFTAAVLSLFPCCAAADDERGDPLVEELFVTETVYPQDQGHWQQTLRPSYLVNGPEDDRFTLQASIEYGITDQFQIEAAWIGYQKHSPGEDGSGDTELGLKYSFGENNTAGMQLAIGFEVTFPTGDIDKGLTDGFRVYEPFAVVSKDISNASKHR